MKVSVNWLKEFVPIEVSVDELCQKMTMLGLEIEAVERPGDEIQNVVIGHIISIDSHPDADKLVVCKTEVGNGETVQIVCGARNMKVGDKVPTALIGGTLPGGFKIGKRKMRGVESQGMMCSARELGLGEEHDGLLILDTGLEAGTDARQALGLDDVILNIEITPNRNDWSGIIGIARELSAAYDLPMTIPEVELDEEVTDATSLSSVLIEDPDLCPRYVGRIVRGVTIGPSPLWMVQRLVGAGLRPINNIVDITNYVLMETGQPLHAFDFQKLQQNRIVVRRAQYKEEIRTIDQEDRSLSEDMLVIADGLQPVAVAGVMGGLYSEVGEGTTDVFVESAYFLPASVRRTSRTLNLISEASQRFQRGADPEMVPYAANRVCQLIQKLAGGKLAKGMLDEYPNPLPEIRLQLRFDRTDRLLGSNVPGETQRKILVSLGFQAADMTDDTLEVVVPTWRHDVKEEADLIEEVARLHGYDSIRPTIPRVRRNETVFAPQYARLCALSKRLASWGLTEALSWTFSSGSEIVNTKLGAPYDDMVVIENPLSENYSTLRSTLIPAMLKLVSNNLRKGSLSVSAFEIGPVFHPNPRDDQPTQHTHLGIVLTGQSSADHWSQSQNAVDFYDITGYAEEVISFLGAECVFCPSESDTFVSGHSAQVVHHEETIGTLGLVSQDVTDAFEIERQVYLLELKLDGLLSAAPPARQFSEIPVYPQSLLDLAVVVDKATPAGELKEVISKSGGKYLKTVEIFDIYEGEQVGEGKKSVAFSLAFQSPQRTLTDKDTHKVFNKILQRLEKDFGARLR